MPITVVELVQCLREAADGCLSPLTICENDPEFSVKLLSIYMDLGTPHDDRYLAIIHLRNFVRRFWKDKVDESVKSVVRDMMITAMKRFEPSDMCRTFFPVVLRQLVRFDYPTKWPELDTTFKGLFSEMTSSDYRMDHQTVMYFHGAIKEIVSKRLMADRLAWMETLPHLFPAFHSVHRMASLDDRGNRDMVRRLDIVALIFATFILPASDPSAVATVHHLVNSYASRFRDVESERDPYQHMLSVTKWLSILLEHRPLMLSGSNISDLLISSSRPSKTQCLARFLYVIGRSPFFNDTPLGDPLLRQEYIKFLGHMGGPLEVGMRLVRELGSTQRRRAWIRDPTIRSAMVEEEPYDDDGYIVILYRAIQAMETFDVNRELRRSLITEISNFTISSERDIEYLLLKMHWLLLSRQFPADDGIRMEAGLDRAPEEDPFMILDALGPVIRTVLSKKPLMHTVLVQGICGAIETVAYRAPVSRGSVEHRRYAANVLSSLSSSEELEIRKAVLHAAGPLALKWADDVEWDELEQDLLVMGSDVIAESVGLMEYDDMVICLSCIFNIGRNYYSDGRSPDGRKNERGGGLVPIPAILRPELLRAIVSHYPTEECMSTLFAAVQEVIQAMPVPVIPEDFVLAVSHMLVDIILRLHGHGGGGNVLMGAMHLWTATIRRMDFTQMSVMETATTNHKYLQYRDGIQSPVVHAEVLAVLEALAVEARGTSRYNATGNPSLLLHILNNGLEVERVVHFALIGASGAPSSIKCKCLALVMLCANYRQQSQSPRREQAMLHLLISFLGHCIDERQNVMFGDSTMTSRVEVYAVAMLLGTYALVHPLLMLQLLKEGVRLMNTHPWGIAQGLVGFLDRVDEGVVKCGLLALACLDLVLWLDEMGTEGEKVLLHADEVLNRVEDVQGRILRREEVGGGKLYPPGFYETWKSLITEPTSHGLNGIPVRMPSWSWIPDAVQRVLHTTDPTGELVSRHVVWEETALGRSEILKHVILRMRRVSQEMINSVCSKFPWAQQKMVERMRR